MKKLLFILLFVCLQAGAQTFTITDGTTVQSNFAGIGINIGHDAYDQFPVLKNLCFQNCGFEPPAGGHLIQVGGQNTGNTTYFTSFNEFASYPANLLYGATVAQWRQGALVGSTTVDSNNPNCDTTCLNGVLSGSTLGSITINTASQPGFCNGTYNVYIHGGGGSGATGSITITGATQTGTGCTGGSITATSVTAAGTGYTSAPTISILTGFHTSATSASGGYNGAGDYNIVRYSFPNTQQSYWNNMQWGLSGSGSFVGETSDLPASPCNQPAGSSNSQAIDITGPETATQGFDTGHQGGQNQVNLVGPYTIKVCAKSVSGTGAFTWNLNRINNSTYCSGTGTATGSWTVLILTSSCSPGENSSTLTGNAQIVLSVGSGNEIRFDNLSIIGPDTNPTDFTDAYVAKLQAMGGPIRILDANPFTLPVSAILAPDLASQSPNQFGEGSNCISQSWPCPKTPTITLPMALTLAVYLGTDLTYAMPATTTPTDWATVMEFLNGGCGTTGGAIRCAEAQGVTTWISSMGVHKIHLALGNENWNCFGGTGGKWCNVQSLGANEYTPYGYFGQAGAAALKADASYSNHVDFVLGAQTTGTFPTDALFLPSTGISPSVDTIEQGPYNGYYVNGVMPGGSLSSFSLSAAQGGSDPTNQLVSQFAEAYYDSNVSTANLYKMANAGYPQRVSVYEYGPGQNGAGTTSGTPTTAQLFGWQYGLSQALVDLTEGLENFKNLGIKIQHRFTMMNYQQSFNNGAGTVSNLIWGSVIGTDAQTNNNNRPTFYALGGLNKCANFGSTLTGGAWTSNPTFSYSVANGIPSIASVPYLYGYAFKNGSARCLILVNNDIASHTVTLSGWPAVGTVTKVLLTSSAPTDSNESSLVVQNATTFPPAPSSVVMPGYSAVFLSGTISAMPVGFSGSVKLSGNAKIQ